VPFVVQKGDHEGRPYFVPFVAFVVQKGDHEGRPYFVPFVPFVVQKPLIAVNHLLVAFFTISSLSPKRVRDRPLAETRPRREGGRRGGLGSVL
jgi:hypothetical protein